jgi:hypothetical protein
MRKRRRNRQCPAVAVRMNNTKIYHREAAKGNANPPRRSDHVQDKVLFQIYKLTQKSETLEGAYPDAQTPHMCCFVQIMRTLFGGVEARTGKWAEGRHISTRLKNGASGNRSSERNSNPQPMRATFLKNQYLD